MAERGSLNKQRVEPNMRVNPIFNPDGLKSKLKLTKRLRIRAEFSVAPGVYFFRSISFVFKSLLQSSLAHCLQLSVSQQQLCSSACLVLSKLGKAPEYFYFNRWIKGLVQVNQNCRLFGQWFKNTLPRCLWWASFSFRWLEWGVFYNELTR